MCGDGGADGGLGGGDNSTDNSVSDPGVNGLGDPGNAGGIGGIGGPGDGISADAGNSADAPSPAQGAAAAAGRDAAMAEALGALGAIGAQGPVGVVDGISQSSRAALGKNDDAAVAGFGGMFGGLNQAQAGWEGRSATPGEVAQDVATSVTGIGLNGMPTTFGTVLASPMMSAVNMGLTAVNPALGTVAGVARNAALGNYGSAALGVLGAAPGPIGQAASALGTLSSLAGLSNTAFGTSVPTANSIANSMIDGFSSPSNAAQAVAGANPGGGLLGGSYNGPSAPQANGGNSAPGGYQAQPQPLPQSGILASAAPQAPIMQAQQPLPSVPAGLLNVWQGNQLYIPPYA